MSCNGEKLLDVGSITLFNNVDSLNNNVHNEVFLQTALHYEGLIITDEDIVTQVIPRKVINVSSIKYITYINYSTSSEIICP